MLRSSSSGGCSTDDGTRRPSHGPSRDHGPSRHDHVPSPRDHVRDHAHLRWSWSRPGTRRTSSPCPPHKLREARLPPTRASGPSEHQLSRSPFSFSPILFRRKAKPFQRSFGAEIRAPAVVIKALESSLVLSRSVTVSLREMFPAAGPDAPDNPKNIWQISENGQANAGVLPRRVVPQRGMKRCSACEVLSNLTHRIRRPRHNFDTPTRIAMHDCLMTREANISILSITLHHLREISPHAGAALLRPALNLK